ncbi:hypothetical protein HELRODRAFT_183251 [Helobdella robusta]|uniref:Uncharacterized protein n=1 Tax=Helobdella robusta TaxID=6412 RepID=T1FJD5_HELRO|nr:hypothetical protein HELRODRAFT_183251 [Helobdella robusta]ESO11371.1 hypothetical protein HELRODRAFT_183251 [Helobdella robusta]
MMKSFNPSSPSTGYPLDSSRMATNLPQTVSNLHGAVPSANQVFIVQAPRLKRTYDSYELSFANICGMVQCFCGIFSLALGIASPLECGELGFIGYGVWGGVMIMTTMVLSIINSCLGAIQFSLGTYSAHMNNLRLSLAASLRRCPYAVATYPNSIDWIGAVVIDSLLACTGLIEMLAAIFASIICCAVVCGPQDYTTASDVPVRRNRVLPAQFVFTSNQPPQSLGNQTYITEHDFGSLFIAIALF